MANHGKAGLWQVTVTISGGGRAMPDLSKLPPSAIAKMKAMGVQVSGNSITSQHCMTQKEVSADVAPTGDRATAKGCTMSNAHSTGNSYSADMTCPRGTGHVDFTFDKAEHYYGTVTMNAMINGQPYNRTTKIDAHWISVDCGSLAH